MPSWEPESNLSQVLGRPWPDKRWLVCGIDEVGRGCLAGPVLACALAFKTTECDFLPQVKDSKLLSPSVRKRISEQLRNSCYWAVGSASVEEIDALNILQASLLAMRRAYHDLVFLCSSAQANIVGALVDGKTHLDLPVPSKSLIKGDSLSYSIAGASIIAKVHRDKLMDDIDAEFQGKYGFSSNNSYATRAHLQALELYGPSSHHRKSFAPVKKYLSKVVS